MQNSAYKFSKFVYILYNQRYFIDTYSFWIEKSHKYILRYNMYIG